MALTVTKRDDGFAPIAAVFGCFQRVMLAPGVSDYTTGGYALSGAQVGLGASGGPANNGLHGVLIEGCNTAALGYVPYYNEQTGKWQVFESPAVASTPSAAAQLSEVAAGTNLTGAVWYVIYEAVSE
jgi:hypothetical protein